MTSRNKIIHAFPGAFPGVTVAPVNQIGPKELIQSGRSSENDIDLCMTPQSAGVLHTPRGGCSAGHLNSCGTTGQLETLQMDDAVLSEPRTERNDPTRGQQTDSVHTESRCDGLQSVSQQR